MYRLKKQTIYDTQQFMGLIPSAVQFNVLTSTQLYSTDDVIGDSKTNTAAEKHESLRLFALQ